MKFGQEPGWGKKTLAVGKIHLLANWSIHLPLCYTLFLPFSEITLFLPGLHFTAMTNWPHHCNSFDSGPPLRGTDDDVPKLQIKGNGKAWAAKE